MRMHNGVWAWYLILANYVHNEVNNVKDYETNNMDGKNKMTIREEKTFCISLNTRVVCNPMLEPLFAPYHMSLANILRWVVELGQFDIAIKISLLVCHIALPMEGHIEAALNLFAYLGLHYNSWI